MEKIIGIAIILMLVSIGLLSGCTETSEDAYLYHTGIVIDCIREEVSVSLAQSILVTYVIFDDGTTFRFNKGRTGELYIYCTNHLNETVTLKYLKRDNHHTISDFYLGNRVINNG